jgi:signal transduction histidine kinase
MSNEVKEANKVVKMREVTDNVGAIVLFRERPEPSPTRFVAPTNADSLADALVAGQLSERTRKAYAGRLEVSDTGCGIPEERLARLGERFYRVDDARTRKGGGTGLGLAICKSILAAHGGTLLTSSTLGTGTTVVLEIP